MRRDPTFRNPLVLAADAVGLIILLVVILPL